METPEFLWNKLAMRYVNIKNLTANIKYYIEKIEKILDKSIEDLNLYDSMQMRRNLEDIEEYIIDIDADVSELIEKIEDMKKILKEYEKDIRGFKRKRWRIYSDIYRSQHRKNYY